MVEAGGSLEAIAITKVRNVLMAWTKARREVVRFWTYYESNRSFIYWLSSASF